MGAVKQYQLGIRDAGCNACVEFYNKHKRAPCEGDVAELVPLVAKEMAEQGYHSVSHDDLENAALDGIEYWDQ